MALSKSKRTIEFVLTAKDRTARAFRSAQTGISKLAKSAAAFARSAGIGLGLFGGAAGAGALAAITAHVKEIDALGKSAESLGIQVEELSKLGFAAELAGSSLTGLTDALEKMLNRVSKAAEGTGEAKDAIRELGLDAAELEKLAPEDQFKKLADAISVLGTNADKVRLKRAIFGRGDSNIINLLNMTTLGIDEAGESLERLDNVVTGADTKAAADLADSMLRMSASFDALGKSVGGPIVSSINTLFEMFGLDVGIGAVNSDIAILRTEIERTQRLLSEGGEGFLEGFAAVFTPDSVLRERIAKYRARLDELLKVREDHSRKRAEQEKNEEAIVAAQEHEKALSDVSKAGLDRLKTGLKAKEAEFKRHEAALAASRDKQKELLQSIADAGKEFEDFGKETPAPDRFDIVEATGTAWDNINAGDTSGARAAIQALIDMFREYQEAGKASAADVVLITGQLEALGKVTNDISGEGLEERAERAAAAAQDLKDEIEGKPIGATVEAAEGSGKKVLDGTQAQIEAEQANKPLRATVELGLAWGSNMPGVMTQGDYDRNGPGSDVRNESDKRGFRI